MCWNIQFLEGDKVVNEISTVEEAIAMFGRENVQFHDGTFPSADERHDYCLCPVDCELLAQTCGYRMIEHPDPRWSSIDHRFEKATKC